MPIQLQGYGGVVGEVDGTMFRAQRVTPRPTDYGVLGHYKAAVVTGSIAAGAAQASETFQFRWADATRFAVVTLVRVDYLYATTAFTAGLGTARMTVARGWTVAGTGGSVATLTGNNNKQRTSMGSSLQGVSGEIRYSTTAALGAGTKTFDVQDQGQYVDAISATTNANLLTVKPLDFFNPSTGDGEHPLVLAQNEGFAIRHTVPATGVWTAGYTVRWTEVTAY